MPTPTGRMPVRVNDLLSIQIFPKSTHTPIHSETMRYLLSFIRLIAAFVLLASVARAEHLEVEPGEDRVTVKVDGKLFAVYLTESETRPAVWPILGPTGKEMTRAFPHRPASEGQRSDHPWHRSVWFAHSDVNGTDFWHEGRGGGIVKHQKFLQVKGGKQAVIVAANDWINSDDERECSDIRSLTFGADQYTRWIDFDITILAIDKDVVFGDSKNGCLGVRAATAMKVDAESDGRIVNNLGDVNKETWGKKASWVDYQGLIADEALGIAVFNHQNSFRFPTYWHVRTYGLCAANPFGVRAFENSDDFDGSFTLSKGDTISLFYRIILHTGDDDEANIHQRFLRYAKLDKTSLASVTADERLERASGQSGSPAAADKTASK